MPRTAEHIDGGAPTASEVVDRHRRCRPPHFDLAHKLHNLAAGIVVTTEILALTHGCLASGRQRLGSR
jgi:hypothetical protein